MMKAYEHTAPGCQVAGSPYDRGLPWHPQEYNEHTSNDIVNALYGAFMHSAVQETYRHPGLHMGFLDHGVTWGIPNIQETIRPGISTKQLAAMHYPIPPAFAGV